MEITQDQKEEIKSKALTLIAEAKESRDSFVELGVIYRNQIVMGNEDYHAEQYAYLQSKSTYISGDAFRIVEAKVGKQLKIFFGGQDVIQVQGANDQAAKDRQKVVNYQLTEINKGFTLFQQTFFDAYVNGNGFLKCSHYKKEEWMDLPPMPIMESLIGGLKRMINSDPMRKITGIKKGETTHIVNGKQKILVEQYPKLENVPFEDFLISPRARSISSADFVCHCPMKRINEINENRISKGGMYWDEAVDILDNSAPEDTMNSTKQSVINPEYVRYPITDNDKPTRLYECYFNFELNKNEGIEPIIATIAGSELLRAEPNEYKRPPLFRFPVNKSNKFWPDAIMVNYIAKLTEMDTVLVRLWLANLALNNDPQLGVITKCIEDMNDLDNREKVVKFRNVEDIRSAMMPLPLLPMDSSTGTFMEIKEAKLEKLSTVTRINSGTGGEAQGLNKTATGMQLTVGLSNQDDENAARIFAESEDGVADLFEFMVQLNEEYPPPDDEVLQLLGHPMTPSPGNAKYRFTVDPTLGTGVKQQNIQNLQNMSQEAPQLVQLGLMGPQQIYNLEKRKYEEMGIKDVSPYLINPEEQQNGQNIPGAMPSQSGLIPGMQGAPNGMPGGMPQGNPG